MPLRIRNFVSWIGLNLKKRRWLVMPLFGVVVVLTEAWEHISVRESLFTIHFSTEVVIYGFAVPLLGALLLSWLDKVELDRDLAVSELSHKQEFSNQLRSSTNRDDLVRMIAQFPQTILPIESSLLFTNNPDHDNFELAASWNEKSNHNSSPEMNIDFSQCQSCKLWSAPLIGLQKCSSLIDNQSIVESKLYCLPLAFKSYVTGILTFSLPEKQTINNQQVQTLRDFAPEMALALENNRLQNMVQNQAEVSINERKRLAQDLHDTLGQNISYLRIKLDQISEQHSLLSIGEIENDLARMRDIADDAYQQVRGTLADLHPSAHVELEQFIRDLLEKVALRADLQFEIIIHGEPNPIRSHVKRQVLYIFREALNNIEKHAGARSVKVQLEWGREDLSLTIVDDGIGLDLLDFDGNDHLGMTIMTERANDINAVLTLDSQVGQGTSVSLIVPLTAFPIRG